MKSGHINVTGFGFLIVPMHICTSALPLAGVSVMFIT